MKITAFLTVLHPSGKGVFQSECILGSGTDEISQFLNN
jgi:hypothetical protein